MLSVEDRFWSKVHKTDNGCWIWSASSRCKGYGAFGLRQYEIVYAHRFSWELANGPVPEGKWVLHHCDNRACVNPAHLFLGTHDDNMADMVAKNRQARGERQGSAKLTREKVLTIMELARGGETHRNIARRFGVSQSLVSYISRGERWGWLVRAERKAVEKLPLL